MTGEVIPAASHGFEIAALIANGLVTFVAAGAGAYFAFRFAKVQRDAENEDANVVGGNLALLALTEIWNITRQYQTMTVDEWREKPDAWLNFPATPPTDTTAVAFDSASLAFLLESSPADVQRGLLEKHRFDSLFTLVNQHSMLATGEVFPTLTRAGVGMAPMRGEAAQGHDIRRAEAEIERILGAGLVRQLRVLTEGIIGSTDDNVRSCREAFVHLRRTLKTFYPTRKFLDMPPEPAPAPVAKT